MKKLKIIGAAVLLAVCVAKLSVAGEHCKHGKHHGMKEVHMHQMHIFKKLDLSDEQKAEVKQIFKAEKPEMKRKHEARLALKERLQEAATQPTIDNAKVAEIADQTAALAKEAAIHKAQTTHKVYTLLNAEQQAKYKTIMQKKLQKKRDH